MLVPIFVQPISIILLLWHKYSAPLQQQHNWCQPFLPVARPSIANCGAPVPATHPQPLIRPHCPFPIISNWTIKPSKPAPPSYFLTNTPSDVSLTCHSKPFSNQQAKPSPVRQSCNSSTDYLLLQAILELTRQALWANPLIPHQITCPFMPFLNQNSKRRESVL